MIVEEDWLGIILQWLFLMGLLSIPFISGWLFGRLAKQNNRERWAFFIVGTVIFIAGIVLGAQVEYFLLEFSEPRESGRSISGGLLRLPIAILISAVLYFILKRNWRKTSSGK